MVIAPGGGARRGGTAYIGGMPWVARALWAVVSVSLALLLLWAAIALPDRVPMKLDAAGYPQEWGSKAGLLAALALAAACCWAMGPLASRFHRAGGVGVCR